METITKTGYAEMADKIRRREPFTGNSAKGLWITDNLYAVMSYETTIATYSTGGLVWLDGDFYSKTTSRLQNMVRELWEVEK